MACRRLISLLLLFAPLAACASTLQPEARPDAAQRMADQAIVYNESYAKAVTGQILLNILRARDRQPRYYLSMSGITDDSTNGRSASADIGGVPLGNPGNPWGVFSFGGSRYYESNPAYKVEPFDKDTLAKAIFNPTDSTVFTHYWQGGWPRDMLVLMLVDHITRIAPGAAAGKYVVQDFENEANNIANDCNDDVKSSGCDFVRAMREMLNAAAAAEARDTSADDRSKQLRKDCQPLDDYTQDGKLLQAAYERLAKVCQPRLELPGAVYVLNLRSFDEAVYYVGELLRPAVTQKVSGEMSAQVNVRAAGLKGGGAGVPLFRLLSESKASAELSGDQRSRFAASVLYGGVRFYAGAPVGRACAAANSDVCADDAARGDRTSSVLSLLSELLSLNQSPEAIKPPARSVR
ncbi:MAG: hypothetical protein ABWZ40_01730 [Caulobacterales bacterium]